MISANAANSPIKSFAFYEHLPAFHQFTQFHNPEFYQPLPDDWYVVVTDVMGSTKAIEQNRYKEVNGVGVASIVAILNAVKPLLIPYVFGGDGVTACIPETQLETVKPALQAAENMSRDQFDLQLRIGLVPMKYLREQGFDVLVGKYQPHAYYQQAMFLGNGLGYAEKLVKQPGENNPYLVKQVECADNRIFEGFECRWNEIPSPAEESISLLVQALPESFEQRNQIYAKALDAVGDIYGDDVAHHPLNENGLSLTSSSKLLSVESKIRTAFSSHMAGFQYLLKLHITKWIGWWLMKNEVKTENTEWGQYKKNVVLNTDYRKFDEQLRMIISGSKAQRLQLREYLESQRKQQQLVFGIHAAPGSLITCVVHDYDKNHIHFLDGSNGGYAMAAREMKQQLAEARG